MPRNTRADSEEPQHLKGAGNSLDLAVATGPAFALITTAITARVLGPENRGILASLIVWAQVFAITALLGLNRSLVAAGRDLALDSRAIASVHRSAGLRLRWAVPLAALLSGLLVGLTSELLWMGVTATILTVAIAHVEWLATLALAQGSWNVYKYFRFLQPFAYACMASLLLFFTKLPQQWLLFLTCVAVLLSFLVELLILPTSRAAAPADRRELQWVSRTGLNFWPTGMSALVSGRVAILFAPLALTMRDVGLISAAGAPAAALGALGAAAMIRSLTGTQSQFPVRRWLAILAMSGMAAIVMPWAIPLTFGSEFVEAVVPSQLLMAIAPMQYIIQWGTGKMAGRGPGASLAPQLVIIITVAIGVLVSPGSLLHFVIVVDFAFIGATAVTLFLTLRNVPKRDGAATC